MIKFLSSLGSLQGIVTVVAAVVVIAAFYFINKGKKIFRKLTTRDVVAIGIGAALYGVLSFISIPVGPDSSFRIALALLTIFGAIFGPVVGFLAGFIGHSLNDALTYGTVWWTWTFISASVGFFSGLIKLDKNFDVLGGKMNKLQTAKLYILTYAGLLVGLALAFIGDIVLYGSTPNKEWLQIGLVGGTDVVVIAVISIPVVAAIAKIRSKGTSLEKEKDDGDNKEN